MSVENVKAFYAKAMGDEDLRKSLKDLGEKSKNKKDEAIAGLIALGKDNGFDFGPNHWAEAVAAGPGEMSLEDLDKVAGGGGIVECNPIFIVLCNEVTPLVSCPSGMAF
jgi:predicted ribosomally synthesized peptide with nif11-like leader